MGNMTKKINNEQISDLSPRKLFKVAKDAGGSNENKITRLGPNSSQVKVTHYLTFLSLIFLIVK